MGEPREEWTEPPNEADGAEMMRVIGDAIYRFGDHCVSDRERPYDGQPHTGERSKTLVSGLTFRDVADCFVLGFLRATGQWSLAESGTATENDVYAAAQSDPNFDPMAACRNMLCEMEKRMGIYPNLPGQHFGESP